MKRFLGRALALLLALVSIGVVYVGFVLWRSGGGVPDWNGTLEVAGLGDRVEVIRDENGIPHIGASSLEDLYFAQGFVHAQDRLWQMAFVRQLAGGRLSEWLGPGALERDRNWRMYDFVGLSERTWNEFPEPERSLVDAYSRGVNAWLTSSEFRRPPEMVLLHVDPVAWHPTDSILLGYYFQLVQLADGGEWLSAVLDLGGASPSIQDAIMSWPLTVPTIIPGSTSDSAAQPTGSSPEAANSNSWTLAGAHTVSGAPLMANDPHRELVLPAAWQLQRHDAPGIAGAGASFPGLPGILLGHNGAVSWAMTNANVDAGDIVFIQPHPDDAGRYRRSADAPWETFQFRPEGFSVRLGDDLVDTVRITSTGVLAPSGASPPLTRRDDLVEERRMWGLELPGTHLVGLLRLQQAKSIEEGMSAVEAIPGPLMNLSLADTAGSIGYVTLGRIASRPEAHATTVAFGPEDSNEGDYIPVAENPRLVNPPSGRIVTSNQRIVGPEYPHYLSATWSNRGRASRIHEMLDEREKHDAASFRAMQNDAMSPAARQIVPLLVQAEASRPSDAELISILTEWDYRFALDASAATVFVTWLGFLDRRVVGDEVDGAPSGSLVMSEFRTIPLALSGQRPEWCDDRRTNERESCADILTTTLRETRDDLDESFGSDPAEWGWGTAASFRLAHAPFDGFPLLRARFSRSTPIPGGPESLFSNYVSPGSGLALSRTLSVPTFQAVYDLADLDASLFMASGGASGHFKSPYYDNLTPRWVRGERFTLPGSDVTAVATLFLEPAPGGR